MRAIFTLIGLVILVFWFHSTGFHDGYRNGWNDRIAAEHGR